MAASHSTVYTFGFAAAVCVVCSLFVAGSAVLLKPRQDENRRLDRQAKILSVAGRIGEGEAVGREEIARRFEKQVRPRAVRLRTGEYDDSVDSKTFDARAAAKDPARSAEAPANAAKVLRVAEHAVVYEVLSGDGKVELFVLPIEGKGLWSTLYGFLALEADGVTIRGLTFYEHGETPGLGGEVDNPRWKALWKDRKALDESGQPRIEVVRGQAGPPEAAPHQVDGLSGATLTGRGVTNTLTFWLGENGFGPYLSRIRAGGAR